MSEMDDKLNAILSNPKMMQQIMSLAQSFNESGNNEQQAPSKNDDTVHSFPQGINPTMLTKISNLMQYGTIDKNQQSLLKALTPYLSRQKIQKLERAMHAAKMAGMASEFVGIRGSKSSFGR